MQKHLLSLFLIFTAQNILAEAGNVVDQLNESIQTTITQSYKQSDNQSGIHVKSDLEKKYEKYLDVQNRLAEKELEEKRIKELSEVVGAAISIAIAIYMGCYIYAKMNE